MLFEPVYDDATCPLSGYTGFTFRVLVNPTTAVKTDWIRGDLGAADCAACKNGRAGDPTFYCPSCAARRAQFGRAAHAIFRQTKAQGFDFSTEAAALACFDDESIPEEFIAWLYMLPGALWSARYEQLKKMVASPLERKEGTS